MTIKSFKCSETKAIYEGGQSKRFKNFQSVAERKLQMLDNAVEVIDLRSPPGNHFELLHGDREGQHSIRINDKWRLCFVWTELGPEAVEIVDYH